MLQVLLRPFAYLSIRHSDPVFRWINWWIPVLAFSLTSLSWFIPHIVDNFGYVKPQAADIWSGTGLISKMQGFVQSLPGFYTAALAVVATFNTAEMLREMPGVPPRMRFLVEGKLTGELDLNRRLFLSAMFAYLTVLSVLLAVGGFLALSVAPALKSMLLPVVVPYLSAIAAGVYMLFFVQMLTVTAWGIYYLGERIHLNDGPADVGS